MAWLNFVLISQEFPLLCDTWPFCFDNNLIVAFFSISNISIWVSLLFHCHKHLSTKAQGNASDGSAEFLCSLYFVILLKKFVWW